MTIEIKQHEAAKPIPLNETFEAVDWQEGQPLFAKRIKIFPKRVKGLFRTIKWWFLGVLLGIYYLLPWVRWDRGEFAPDQAVLFDIASRRFYFFDIEIWPQEIIYLVGILAGAAMGLFFVTSLIGRAWCAFGCPQTVWTDLFMFIERRIEGDRNQRIKLDKGPWTFKKIRKRVIKHALWLVVSAGTGGAWAFYFMDAPTLASGLMHLHAPTAAWITVGLLTSMTYVMAGFAREQVCTYMCPYSRFQSAMMDKETWMVSYKADRGEVRGKHKRGTTWDNRGHCVDCTQCVAVCPMGIDIRNGMQMECINCGLCADACNNVMSRLDLPSGLIGYDSLSNVERRSRGEAEKPFTLLRVRTFMYLAALSIVASFLVSSFMLRKDVGLSVIRDRNPVFVMLSNGDIRDGYTVKILNKSRTQRTYQLEILGLSDPMLEETGHNTGFQPSLQLTVAPDEVEDFRIYVRQHNSDLHTTQTEVVFRLLDKNGDEAIREGTQFIGPEK